MPGGENWKAFSTAVLGATLPLGAAADKLVWSKIREGVGGRVKVVVSGGSSLPSYLEDFFEMAGLRWELLSLMYIYIYFQKTKNLTRLTSTMRARYNQIVTCNKIRIKMNTLSFCVFVPENH